MRASRVVSLCSASAAAAVLLAAADGGAATERGPAGASPGNAAETTVANGQAQAVLARLVPYVGLPGVAASIGFTAAQVEGETARASAAAADLGLLGTLASASAGDSAPALPGPITADSEGTQLVDRDPFAAPGAPAAAPADPSAPSIGGAHERAEATNKPVAASGITTGPAMNIPGVIEMSGGQSRSDSTVERAASDVTIGSLNLGAGAVVLNGLHWTASQAGKAAAVSAFDLGGMTVSGQAMPVSTPAELAESVAKANEALAPLGLALSAPTKTADASGGTVAPLVLQVRNPESLVAPSAQAGEVTKPVIAELTKAIIAANPDAAAAQIVLNAATGAAGGRSGGRLELGGVSARFARIAVADQGAAPLLPATTDLTSALPAVGGTTPGSAGQAGAAGAPGASSTFGGAVPDASLDFAAPAVGTLPDSGVVAADPSAVNMNGMAIGEVVTTPQTTGINTSAASFQAADGTDRASTTFALALGLFAVLVLAVGDRIRIRRLTR